MVIALLLVVFALLALSGLLALASRAEDSLERALVGDPADETVSSTT